MKRLLPLLLLLLLLAPALAEDDPAALMLAAHPGYVIETSADGGDAYAAILREAEQRVLCAAGAALSLQIYAVLPFGRRARMARHPPNDLVRAP